MLTTRQMFEITRRLAIAEFKLIMRIISEVGLNALSVKTVKYIKECNKIFEDYKLDVRDSRHKEL